MRDERSDNHSRNYDAANSDSEPRWLHGHHHGQNSDRGNYPRDSHFNRGYGDNSFSQYGDDSSFSSNADQRQMSPQGRFRAGGAPYSGDDYTRGNSSPDNPYGMTYFREDGHNSSRHYDSRADYRDRDYSAFGDNGHSHNRYGMADERFGHEVRRGENEGGWARGSRGDFESYRRYEQGNRMYDDDYSAGFAGRNYTDGDTPHYGEGSHYSSMDRGREDSGQHGDRYDYMRGRDRR
ncbi:hypothetical protein [Pontibacter russatus]|uniref:hypothetical protein n=1 Tax=Pontibacter russatus TaxID=2694929 RepID=UPI00137B8831|nr:hypothetical protein [Pontibacter russatus]